MVKTLLYLFVIITAIITFIYFTKHTNTKPTLVIEHEDIKVWKIIIDNNPVYFTTQSRILIPRYEMRDYLLPE